MSDPTIGPVDLEQIEEDERREKIRNRALLGLILLIGLAVAFWVGSIVSANQEEATKAEVATEQAQVEKFNLAQQIAVACAAETKESLDADTYRRLCSDARQIVREGPQGAQGIPGAQGVQGIPGAQGVQGIPGVPGADGADGVDGNTGPAGPPGEAGPAGATGEQGPAGDQGPQGETGPQGPEGAPGEPGAMGPAGPQGEAGEPPVSWVVFGPNETVIERCERVPDFNRDAPEYACSRV